MSNWIDFKELRSKLDFEAVLRSFNVEVKRKGKQHQGYCPLPNHKGNRNSPSFSANLEQGIFQCFGCGAKGNVLDFAVMMQGKNPRDGAALRKVALELREKFCPELSSKPNGALDEPEQPELPVSGESDMPRIVNAPLDFELKGLDAEHEYLKRRGFTIETVKHFGLGYCTRGLLKSRIAIPLHDREGKLVGYAGRVVDDSTITDENPRYRFPGERTREGTIYEFRKTLFLYNGCQITSPVTDLIVVEGFTPVWWLWQNRLPHVVGTMGADCSEKQAELIVSLTNPKGRVWVVPDPNKAGERHAHGVLTLVSPYRFVRWVKLDEGKQPTDLSADELKARFKK